MSARSRIASWAGDHPDLAEGGAGLLAGTAVVAISLVQWGLTDEGWTRGLTLGVAMAVVVAIAVRRDRRRQEARRRAAADQRLQLARDLHDAVASQVSLIGIQAAAGRRVLGGEPERAAEALEAIEVAARTANLDLRQMLGALRADAGTTGALPGLDRLPALVKELRRAGLTVEVVGLHGVQRLPQAQDAAAYRIIQEALANALEHAGRVRASVALSKIEGMLRIVVENEAGRPSTIHSGTGLGVAGMRERAEQLGGRLEAARQPDGTFVVEATLPVART
jgi:signal transduction histidine kinase